MLLYAKSTLCLFFSTVAIGRKKGRSGRKDLVERRREFDPKANANSFVLHYQSNIRMTTIYLKGILLTFFLAFTLCSVVKAQPQRFGAGVIPTDRAFGPAMSPDGRHFYFVNSRGGRDTMTIEMASVLANGLNRAVPTAFSNKPGIWKDIDPFISPDGRKLIFNSNRPAPGKPDKRDFDIWALDLDPNGQPGEPYHLGPEVNSDSADFFATVSASGNLYFSSLREGTKGNVDLYRSDWKDGHYLKPVRLPGPVNSALPESNPYISPDESFLIFLRDGPGGYGDSDLYISFQSGGGWSEPVNLGPEINTEHAEFCPFFDVPTQTLYYGRIVRGKPLKENIYAVKLNPGFFRKK